MIVEIFVAQRQRADPLGKQFADLVFDELGVAAAEEAGGQARRSTSRGSTAPAAGTGNLVPVHRRNAATPNRSEQAQRSNGGPLMCLARQPVRNAFIPPMDFLHRRKLNNLDSGRYNENKFIERRNVLPRCFKIFLIKDGSYARENRI
jgi:hypothetical protein